MQVNLRKESRRKDNRSYTLLWKDLHGHSRSAEAQGIEISDSGIALRSPEELPPGCVGYLEARQGNLKGYCDVRNCSRLGKDFRIGFEFRPETRPSAVSSDEEIDYYEYLQISPKAESATIHRIYKFMAGRLHPDNPETGDPERFLLLNRAYEVLSDPQRRAEYDATRAGGQDARLNPIFEMSEFFSGIEGETNRRLGILSLLYTRRRMSPEHPGISLFEIEKRMGFPREYLEFTTWYLRAKKYITMADNAELTLAADGVDFVESNASTIPILGKLLNSGPRTTTGPESPNAHARRSQGQPLALEAGESDT